MIRGGEAKLKTTKNVSEKKTITKSKLLGAMVKSFREFESVLACGPLLFRSAPEMRAIIED